LGEGLCSIQYPSAGQTVGMGRSGGRDLLPRQLLLLAHIYEGRTTLDKTEQPSLSKERFQYRSHV